MTTRERVSSDMTDKELWKAMDEAVFGTSDVKKIKSMLDEEMAEKKRLEQSLGGFLFVLREERGLTVPQIAAKARVSEELWEMWEGEVAVPTGDELKKLVKNLALYKTTAEKLMKLWQETPFRSLCRMVQFRPQLLAARGVAAVDARGQWELLHQTSQERLRIWGAQRGFSLPDQLFEMLDSLELETEEEQKAWAREVWNEHE